MLSGTEYKRRVIDHFKAKELDPIDGRSPTFLISATQEEWELLGRIFLYASEAGTKCMECMEEFDKRILTSTEFNELYHVEFTVF